MSAVATAPRALAPCWPDATVAIIGGGFSLTADHVEAVRAWRAQRGAERRALAINNAYVLAPWADALWACDLSWWKVHLPDVLETFQGARWTLDVSTGGFKGFNTVRSLRSAGLSRTQGVIHQGGNGGYQAINLAYLAGATKIVLLGFDMRKGPQRDHWHANHPAPLAQNSPYAAWLPQFEPLAADLKAEGVDVVNCTPGSALKAFRMGQLADELTC